MIMDNGVKIDCGGEAGWRRAKEENLDSYNRITIKKEKKRE